MVIIVGGGIAGLTAAIALRQAGVEARVYDRVDDLSSSQIGAGLGLSYNATRVLRALGLLDRVAAAGERGRRFEFRTWKGEPMSEWAVAEGEVQVFITRQALFEVLSSALPPDKIICGKNCVGVVQQESHVTAVFEDGSTARGRLLVGADGLRSLIRTHTVGEHPPRYAGFSVLRCVVPVPASDETLPRGTLRLLWGRGGCFGMYRVAPDLGYIFGWTGAPEGEQIPRGRRKEEFVARYRDWSPEAGDLVARTTEEGIHQTAIYDLSPLESWSKGRVTLMGDAAHAMTFTMGQGACQGLEDAAVLAHCVATAGETPEALKLYESDRAPRAATFIKTSARISRMSLISNPGAVKMRDSILGKASTNMRRADAQLMIEVDWRQAPTVVFTEGPMRGAVIYVRYPFVVGRQRADVEIEDGQLSRRHAMIRPVEGALQVEDLGSTNGTWVNGQRIEGTVPLANGDRVKLGESVLQVVTQPPPAKQPEPAGEVEEKKPRGRRGRH